jgi:hypothetical protein
MQDSESDWPQDQPEQLGSVCELDEPTGAQVMRADASEIIGETHSEEPKVDSTSELKNMLASVLTVIQESNKELQDKMETYHKALENKVDTSIKELKVTRL